MQKYNIYTAKEKNVNSNYFTGKVIIREVIGEMNSTEQEVYHVTFYNGSLTTLHYHESDQILIATKGRGVVGMVEGDRVLKPEVNINSITFLKEGDTVCIPANIIHFHGALNEEDFSHIAIMKMYKLNRDEKSMLKRSVTKWEYDLLREENQEGKKTIEGSINITQREIQERIQRAILRKLTSQDLSTYHNKY
jgi:quercetin dioxygenase-like cupin family protein